MDSRETNNNNNPPPSSHQQLLHPSMTRFQYPNAAPLTAPTSTSQPIHHRLPFGALAPQQMDQKTLDSLGLGDGSSQPMRFPIDQNQNQQEGQKKKRGRPRKYTADGNIALGLAPTSPRPSAAANSYGDGGDGGDGNVNGAKRNRGRPPGSGKKQSDTLPGVTSGSGFVPHIIEISTGEDIAAKMVAFSEQATRIICIISATGAVDSPTLSETSDFTRAVNYKGEFEIASMSGSFNTEIGSTNTSVSLRVSLGGHDGLIFGGAVVGPLVAASEVMVVVGSFFVDDKKSNQSNNNNARVQNPEPVSAAPTANNTLNFGSNSNGLSSESSEESGSPSTHPDTNNNGVYGNSFTPQQQQQIQQMQKFGFWHNPHNHGQ